MLRIRHYKISCYVFIYLGFTVARNGLFLIVLSVQYLLAKFCKKSQFNLHINKETMIFIFTHHSDQGLKITDVDEACHFVNGWSLEVVSTIPLKRA